MFDLLYSTPGGGFERHTVCEVQLTLNGQVLIHDGESSVFRPIVEWSGAEGMFSSLETGAEANDIELAAHGYERLRLWTAGGTLVAEDAGFQLSKLSLAKGLALAAASGDDVAVLRNGEWYQNGTRLGALSVLAALAPEAEVGAIARPGVLSRPSGLAERLIRM